MLLLILVARGSGLVVVVAGTVRLACGSSMGTRGPRVPDGGVGAAPSGGTGRQATEQTEPGVGESTEWLDLAPGEAANSA
ncbi:hypothetical protein HMI59_22890 (plasmid) [Paenarthrobacter sp. YJN-5]|nr:hypothetical protein [Paenarthrobacter sp. YJN-5]QOT19487.1 hypothetical protein HMI59_22890 [Paenarthrobacter sp. YJN-5]